MRSFLLLGVLASLAVAPFQIQPVQTRQPAPQEPTMTDANGSFDIKLSPTGHAPDQALQSLSLSKAYHGDLDATSIGEMLASGGPPSKDGGFVAMERVTGKLAGRSGSFTAMQLGSMSSGTSPQLTMQVVPGSGTGDLSGLYGTMTVAVAPGGHHTYTLHYGFSPK